ncbi:hypothetical protein D6783_02185 [Candidatus Woesearchaeota archaeon]|nr:MAG: hypothetical protein D6783_02185 [Candidatus Woesearchaeota archaeon]
MAILRRVNPMSLAKYTTVFFALFGLVSAIFLIYLAASIGGSVEEGARALGEGYTTSILEDFNYSALIIMPVLGGVIGFLTGAIVGVVYNGLSFLFGGLEIELD